MAIFVIMVHTRFGMIYDYLTPIMRFQSKPGYRCGVELDKPVGKNNGTVNGEYYFTCEPNHGLLVRSRLLLVGFHSITV